MIDRLHIDESGVARCSWCAGDPIYVAYHDQEWGVRLRGDAEWFEKICLEGFQAGLSWLTILRKRELFRSAFDGFDIDSVAAFDDGDVERLVVDAGIVRHRGKITSAINNASRAQEMRAEFGSLDVFMERYRSDRAPGLSSADEIPATSVESTAMSKELRRRGWTFVGPTTMYALMQSAALVDDHFIGCHCRPG